MTELVRPSTRYLETYRAAILEFQAEGRMLNADLKNLSHHIQHLCDMATIPPDGKVRETFFWLVEGETFIGRVSIRHELTDLLRLIGGHIGYEIRPTQRRKGYGTLILKLALDEARQLNLDHVLLTCNADNEGSRRIIMANGGEFQDEITLTGYPSNIQRWWIAL
jgi:predicted acetyltransferase